MLKKWVPTSTDSEEERTMMVDACIKELGSSEPGDHTVYVGQDTLVYGIVDFQGNHHIYETKITASNQDYLEQKKEGAEYVIARESGVH